MENMDEEYENFTLYCDLTEITPASLVTAETMSEEGINKSTYRAVALKGDEFYQGIYLPVTELEKAYTGWNGTLHDINHMGTSHPMGLSVMADIRYFVGYQDNVKFDAKTKTIAMDIHIDKDTLYGKTWLSYVSLCKKAGQTPNVSVTFAAQRGVGKAKDVVFNYADYGFKGDESIVYIKDIRPIALSTVLKGACSDDKGCGINGCSVKPETEGSVTSEKTEEEIQTEKDYEEEKQKLIEQLKKLDKETKK